jgi:hypothetical protein
VHSKKAILAELDSARAEVLEYARSLPDELWNESEGRAWSPARIVAHLAMVDAATLTGLRRAESGDSPRHQLTFRERFLAIPPAAVRHPVMKVRAPSWVRPEADPSREEALRMIAARRRELLAFVETHSEAELHALAVRHPFFGWMSALHGLRLLAAHDRRHLTQMRRAVRQTSKKPRARAVAA